MPLNIGNIQITKAYLGATEVSQIYKNGEALLAGGQGPGVDDPFTSALLSTAGTSYSVNPSFATKSNGNMLVGAKEEASSPGIQFCVLEYDSQFNLVAKHLITNGTSVSTNPAVPMVAIDPVDDSWCVAMYTLATGGQYALVVARFNSSGTQLWSRRYALSTGFGKAPTFIAILPSRRIIVGTTTNSIFYTTLVINTSGAMARQFAYNSIGSTFLSPDSYNSSDGSYCYHSTTVNVKGQNSCFTINYEAEAAASPASYKAWISTNVDDSKRMWTNWVWSGTGDIYWFALVSPQMADAVTPSYPNNIDFYSINMSTGALVRLGSVALTGEVMYPSVGNTTPNALACTQYEPGKLVVGISFGTSLTTAGQTGDLFQVAVDLNAGFEVLNATKYTTSGAPLNFGSINTAHINKFVSDPGGTWSIWPRTGVVSLAQGIQAAGIPDGESRSALMSGVTYNAVNMTAVVGTAVMPLLQVSAASTNFVVRAEQWAAVNNCSLLSSPTPPAEYIGQTQLT